MSSDLETVTSRYAGWLGGAAEDCVVYRTAPQGVTRTQMALVLRGTDAAHREATTETRVQAGFSGQVGPGKPFRGAASQWLLRGESPS